MPLVKLIFHWTKTISGENFKGEKSTCILIFLFVMGKNILSVSLENYHDVTQRTIKFSHSLIKDRYLYC